MLGPGLRDFDRAVAPVHGRLPHAHHFVAEDQRILHAGRGAEGIEHHGALDLLDRLAEHAAHTAPQERARYHFDYARLRADLNRVRAGLQDYLVPQRAQPRDPVPLAGDYVRRDRADDEEPSP